MIALRQEAEGRRQELGVPHESEKRYSPSPMREFETALGQYLIYQTFLSITHPSHTVYLAISHRIYEKFFTQIAIQLILKKYQVLLPIVDINNDKKPC